MTTPTPIATGKDTMKGLSAQGQEALGMLERHFARLSSNEIPCMMPNIKPGDIANQIPVKPPLLPRNFTDILTDVEDVLFPGLTHWQHPRFFAYYPANSSIPAILSELLIAGSGVVGLQWAASPSATELEVRVMDWLAQMIGVGGPFLHTSGVGGGMIQNTAGEAIASVFVCARCALQRRMLFGDGERELTADEREETFYADSSKFVVYMSDQTHFSGPKGVRVAGMRCVKLPSRRALDRNGEETYGLQVEDLRKRITEDKAKGLIPCAVQLNYGTTNTSSSDPIADYEELVKEEKLWLHVDAAYAGPSWILPKFQHRTKDLERVATSFNFNGSKWFLCGFDSAFLWVKDRKLLKHVYAATGDYLAPDEREGDGTFDPEFKDWAVPLGRRFRSLRIWMVLNYYGVSGIQSHLNTAIEQGDTLRKLLDSKPDLFAQPVKTELGLVVFKLKAGDEATGRVADALLHGEEGKNNAFFLFPSVFEGVKVIRVAIGGVLTDHSEITMLWERLLQVAVQETEK